MIHRIIFILVLIFGFVVKAQIPKGEVSVDISVFPQEKVELSINSDLLFAGELIQYKVFVLDLSNKPSELSKVVYVSLRNQEDSIIFSHKLKVERGVANGDFFIPATLKTGIYTLIGYTNFSRNNTQDSFIQKNIYVLNTFIKSEFSNKIADTIQLKTILNNDTGSLSTNDTSENLQITTDKKSYGYREKVTLNVKSSLGSADGNFVLSVRKLNPVEISYNLSYPRESFSSEKFYIPELRGELLSGLVLSKSENQPVANKVVSLTIPGRDYVFKLAKTNDEGRFFFSVSEGYSAEESIVQLNESKENATNFTLVLDDKDFNLKRNDPAFLKIDPSLKDWLEERSVQLQIENAYFDSKIDSILDNKIIPAFYDNLGSLFLLDDYTRFPTVKETFVEVVTQAAVRGSTENSRFLVNNAYDPNRLAKFNDLPPLVIMDGMLVQNNSDVLNYNAREIKSIRVVPQPYRYGPNIYSGIIAFETKAGNFFPSLSKDYVEKIALQPAVKKKQNYRPDYSTESSLSRIPDYRVQLFWYPNLMLLDKEHSASFYTSDVSGSFEITLEGFTQNGVYIISKNFFTVQEN